MELEVLCRSKITRDLIGSLVEHYIEALNLGSSKYKLTVFTVVGMAKNEKAAGSVHIFGDKTLGLAIDSRLSVSMLMETLAHEMVHVKQIARGQLKYVGKKIFWKGERVYPKKMSYYNHPWEIDAWRNEKVLASRVWYLFEKIGVTDKIKFGG